MGRITDTLPDGAVFIQDDRLFKLTQDTVLLSDFARPRPRERVLDLGAGCGGLSLLLLRAHPGIAVDGIERLPEARQLACENMALHGLASRGTQYEGDFRALPAAFAGRYDVCVSNPPYFAAARGRKPSRASIASARCDEDGGIADVCQAAARALRSGGRLYVCYKPERLAALFAALEDGGLEPKTLRFVRQRPGGKASLALVCAAKGGGEWLDVQPPLWIEDASGEKSAEYRRIYHLDDARPPQT